MFVICIAFCLSLCIRLFVIVFAFVHCRLCNCMGFGCAGPSSVDRMENAHTYAVCFGKSVEHIEPIFRSSQFQIDCVHLLTQIQKEAKQKTANTYCFVFRLNFSFAHNRAHTLVDANYEFEKCGNKEKWYILHFTMNWIVLLFNADIRSRKFFLRFFFYIDFVVLGVRYACTPFSLIEFDYSYYNT